MEEINKFVDNLGPLKVIYVHEPSVNLKAILVVEAVNIPSLTVLKKFYMKNIRNLIFYSVNLRR